MNSKNNKLGLGVVVNDENDNVVVGLAIPVSRAFDSTYAEALVLKVALKWCMAIKFPISIIESNSKLLIYKIICNEVDLCNSLSNLLNVTIWYTPRLKIGGDADDADKAVTAVPSADVNPSEDVGGSDKNVKDVEKPKGDESRLKGDDFFDGLSQLVIDDDQVVLAGLEAVAKINVPAPNPDVVGEKSDAIHTDEETEDTVSDTPLLDKRKRAPALKSPFVDFGSADVGSTPMELMSSGSQSAGDDRDFKMVTYVKGLYALNDAFADPVSTEIEAKFDSWIETTS
ncbi:hypothetical protein F8388_024696 [Cannabis sativa]|uniref:RNase H type-1 domain-containing protein n=1 Tax=Cannabis sativa TaxID=3483 RepID=A0A7J6GBQ5_CANSA|nr:hypothetical protein F8388_024696 [Cannabis sativa]